MKKNWLAALGGLAASCALAQTTPKASQQDQLRAMAEAVNRPLVYQVAGEDKVRVQKDRVYRSEPEEKADIYEPADRRGGVKAPIVIFLHGGVPPEVPLRPKDWGIYHGWGRLMAASGFVAVAFNHRLGFPNPMMAEAADDAERLIAYVRGHSAEFGADPDRICLASYSAGGPLLAPYLRQPRPYIRCLAAFYSILDIRDSDHHRRFLKPDQLDLFSPAKQLEEHAATAPPIFLMRAGRDQVPGLNAWMEKFLDIAIRKNAQVTLMIHATGAHGFENTNDDERSREILKAAIEFMKAQVR